MHSHYAKDALAAVIESRPRTLNRILAIRPEVLREAWQEIMTALAAVVDIEIGEFLEIICPVMKIECVYLTLDHPIDADANRVSHWPALYGNTEKLKTLTKFGADLRLPNRLGTTPLFDAVRGGFPEAIEFICGSMGHGVLRNFNIYDCSPMHWACKQGSLAGAQALHTLDPELINLPNSRGGLPLDLLEWRKLYYIDIIERSFGRASAAEELRPYDEIYGWMRLHGARNSGKWASLPSKEKLKKGNSPFNAEFWWKYVQQPTNW